MKKHKVKMVFGIGSIFLLAVSLFPFVQSGVWASEFELKFGALNPEASHMAKIAKNWMAKVEKETSGRVHFTSYWGTLLTPPDAPDEVASGVVDVGNFSAGYTQLGFDIVKNTDLLYFGLSFPEHAKLHLELRKKFPEMDEEYAKYGKIIADSQVLSPMQLLTKKPVRTLADFKGMKIKAIPGYIPILRDLGAEAVMMSMFDCYVALQKGMIDGILSPFETLVPQKLIEIVKSITILNLSYPATHGLLINWHTWDKLSPDIQKVFENNSKFFSDENLKISTEFQDANIAAAKKAGIEFIELSPQDMKKLDEIIYLDAQKKAAELDAKGLPGSAILEEVQRFKSK